MEWADTDVLALIENFRTHPVLWNPGDKFYFNKKMRNEAWREVAEAASVSEEECKRKVVSLQSSYRRERAKVLNRKGNSEGYVSRWFAYEALRFMDEREQLRASTGPTELVPEVVYVDDLTQEGTYTNGELEHNAEEPSQDEGSEELAVPSVPAPKKKKKEDDSFTLLASTLRILETTTGKLCASKENSEVKSFCDFLSSKMLAYSPAARQAIQHSIFEVLIKADEGQFDKK